MFSALDPAENREEKLDQRHILNHESGTWKRRRLGQSSSGRNLGDEGLWSSFPIQVLGSSPFSLYAEPLQGSQLHPTSTSFWVLIEL